MTEVLSMTNAELDAAIAETQAAVDAPTRLQTLKALQAQRRTQAAADATERDALIAALKRQCEAYRTGFLALLKQLDVTAPVDAGPLIEEAYIIGRQAYALSHDFANVIGDRRMAMRYDVADLLAFHGGRVADAFLATLRGRPSAVSTPWHDELRRLRALLTNGD